MFADVLDTWNEFYDPKFSNNDLSDPRPPAAKKVAALFVNFLEVKIPQMFKSKEIFRRSTCHFQPTVPYCINGLKLGT